ncbi:hypothetical protein GDO81_008736 [Engystomops pustulosus]|uniref:Uncharacterized protein n=1 Tax=Engystomops pustulosus TaxID=76066 RepID=A0AAV7CGY8_ENGPU|nr:hypothetical protein GDO81_008736 [Engystomops pustulosus]
MYKALYNVRRTVIARLPGTRRTQINPNSYFTQLNHFPNAIYRSDTLLFPPRIQTVCDFFFVPIQLKGHYTVPMATNHSM